MTDKEIEAPVNLEDLDTEDLCIILDSLQQATASGGFNMDCPALDNIKSVTKMHNIKEELKRTMTPAEIQELKDDTSSCSQKLYRGITK